MAKKPVEKPVELDAQQLVAKDLNDVLQLDPAINLELNEEELEEQIKVNAGEVYYKHPEHGTDQLKESTFAYLLEKGYLVEPEVVETAAEKKAREKAEAKAAKDAEKAAAKKDKPSTPRTGGFKSNPEVAARKEFIAGLITAGKHTAKEIVEQTLAKYPEVSKSSIATLVSDAKNEKYTAFGKVAKQDPETKIMSF